MQMKNNRSIKSWILATRPWSFPASAMPVLTTVAYLYWLGRDVDWYIGIWTLLNVVLFHASGNLWSDYFDFKKGVDKEDVIGATSLTSGEFAPIEIKSFAMALLVAASLSGIALVVCTGLPTLFLGIAGVVLTLLYPTFKYNALGDIDIFLTYSLLPILGTSYVATGAFDTESLWLALPIGLITVGILHSNNMRDIEHDKDAGIKTFAMILGKKRAAYLYCVEMALPFIWVFAGIVSGAFPLVALLVAPSLKLAMDNIVKVLRFCRERDEHLRGIDESTAQLQLVFGILLTLSLFIDKLFIA